LLREEPQISTDEIARRMAITAKGVEWHIGRLKKDRLLKRIGADRGGQWEVLKP
jgi:ATP-dependent DNA helicase RecG